MKNRERPWYGDWGHFLTGVFIGLVIVTPALAMPPDLPIAFSEDLRLYTLMAAGVLLFAALVMRMLHRRDADESEAIDAPRSYGMRFFPSDRPIAIE